MKRKHIEHRIACWSIVHLIASIIDLVAVLEGNKEKKKLRG